MTYAHVAKISLLAVLFGLSGCERQISFADDVQPILNDSCIECHDLASEGYASSGFSLIDYNSVMRGTNFGPVVVAKSSMSSALYLVIASKTSPEIRMPPHHDNSLAKGRATPMSQQQIEIIRDWIDQGAKNN